MKIGFLVTHGPGSEQFAEFERQVEAELGAGNEVSIFADVDGVMGGLLEKDAVGRKPLTGLNSLIHRGVDVTLCRVCLVHRGIHEEPNVVTWARLGDLGDLSSLISTSERIVSL